MSMTDGDGRRPEIIIVRRGGYDEDEGHHGGAWKIAFADFMTAMMCFFLVMWLINAANEQTRAALASYFNPVKLIDRNTSSKGIEEIGQGPQNSGSRDESSDAAPDGERERVSGPLDFQDAADISDARRFSDENLFSDPYAVLAEIAADTGIRQNVSEKGDGGAQDAGPASGASGGQSYRDPFAPDFWSQQVADSQLDAESALEPEEEAEDAGIDTVTAVADAPAPAPESLDEAAEEVARQNREDTARQMREALARQVAENPLAGSVSVETNDSGIVVSITDDLENGMFPVGSAVPMRSLVLAMDEIGNVLSEQAGKIRIHGHTDGRPFRNDAYDNWRLSTARAHAAQYMLVRGGVDEERIAEVSGFADRKLKVPTEPYASANRRIEILLELP